MPTLDKVRIIVLGDSGVGKTSFVHLVCQQQPLRNAKWTIGASVNVKLHDYGSGTPDCRDCFIELWDIGGFTQHKLARKLFYPSANGVILVHDLTNRKSEHNLKRWMAEILNQDSKKHDDFDPEMFADYGIPVLVVGTKYTSETKMEPYSTPVRKIRSPSASSVPHSARSDIAVECFADEIFIDCTNVKMLSPGSSNAFKLDQFFDKVIQRKYSRQFDLTRSIHEPSENHTGIPLQLVQLNYFCKVCKLIHCCYLEYYFPAMSLGMYYSGIPPLLNIIILLAHEKTYIV